LLGLRGRCLSLNSRPRAIPSDVLAPVDVQLRPVDVARHVRTKKIDGLGDFLGFAEPAQRYVLAHDLFRPRRQDRGIDLTG